MVQTGRDRWEPLSETLGGRRHRLSGPLAFGVALVGVGALVALAVALARPVPSAVVDVPLKKGIALVALVAIFVPLERLFALRHQRVLRRCWRADLVYFLVNGYFAMAGSVVVVVVLGIALRAIVPGTVHHAILSQPGALQFAEAFLLSEISEYAAHRSMHTVPWLWRFHKVHHSVEDMDWLASARLHPVDRAITNGAAILPIFVLGFSNATVGVFALFAALHAMVVHANVRFTFGPLRYVIATPQYHHWHHAEEIVNKNFSTKLPVVDWVFRSLHVPARQWPASYGMGEQAPESYLGQLAWPFSGTIVAPDQ
jgi:sterol desaturase/sphingolipid hydroxylase (fatty acid hydroxylase superfamily)